jgi:hypothetical protein
MERSDAVPLGPIRTSLIVSAAKGLNEFDILSDPAGKAQT